MTLQVTRYSTYDRDLSAMYHAVKFFRRFLAGQPVTAFTDHLPLAHAAKQDSNKATPRQQRHLDYVLQQNITLAYVPGKDNVAADALSRTCAVTDAPLLQPADIADAQVLDEELPRILTKSILNLDLQLVDEEAIYVDNSTGIIKPYLPMPLRRAAFDAIRQRSCSDVESTVLAVSQRYVWPGIRENVLRWIRESDEDAAVNDASRTCTISMPTQLDARTICDAQQADVELPHLLKNERLQLAELRIDDKQLHCSVTDNIIRPYLPNCLRRVAFNVIHGLSHPSGRATAKQLATKYFWPGIRKDALRWARQCEPCQKAKVHRHNRTELNRFKEPDERFAHLHVDLIKLPLVQGFSYCLTVIDRFSRWPLAIPLADMRAETVARALYNYWISVFGTPLTITSDQGTQFEGSLFTELSKLVGANHVHTTPYHPKSNGMVERLHRTLKSALKCTPEIPWPDALPTVMLGLRTSLKEDLQASPAEMLFGTTLRIPGEFFVQQTGPTDQASFAAQLRRLFRALKPVAASNHSSMRPFVFKNLKTCTHVFCRLEKIRKPLEQPYTGPHRVIRRVDEKTYVLDFNGTEKTISTDCLKPAYLEPSPSSSTTPSPLPPAPPSSSLLPPSPAPSPSPTPPLAQQPPKTVTFRWPRASVTGEGVAVGSQIIPRSAGKGASRRKQQLCPREVFTTALAPR